MSLTLVIVLGVAFLLLWAAVTDKNPIDKVKATLGGKNMVRSLSKK